MKVDGAQYLPEVFSALQDPPRTSKQHALNTDKPLENTLNNDLNHDLEGVFLVGPEIIQPLCKFMIETFFTRNGQAVQS